MNALQSSAQPSHACRSLAELLTPPSDPARVICIDAQDTCTPHTSLSAGAWHARVTTLRDAWATRPSQRLALCLDDPLDMSCALFAAWAAGKTPVVLPNLLARTRADLAFAYDEAIDTESLAQVMLARDHTKPVGLRSTGLSPACRLAIYTSGSTGEPKAVVKTLRQLDDEVQTLHRHWGKRLENGIVVASVPCHHIYGLWFRILWPLAAGVPFARQTFAEPSHASVWRRWPNVIWIAGPAQLTRWPALIGDGPWIDAPHMAFSSGGPLPAEAARQYVGLTRHAATDAHAAQAPIEVFGSTETGGIAWRQQDASSDWTPLGDTRIRVGDTGALEICSPRVGDGQWWRTDDGATLHADGTFALTGRLDRVVKIEGKRLALPSVESALARHEWVDAAAAAIVSGRLAVIVVLNNAGNRAWAEQSLKSVRETLRRSLAETFDATVLPRRWRFLPALPINERGKRTAADLAACFAPATPWMPSVLGVRLSDGDEGHEAQREGEASPFRVVCTLRVPPGLAHFEGHFPGLPLLPGVVLVDWATRFATQYACEKAARHGWANCTPATLQQVKFSSPVLPGARLELTLTFDATRHRVKYQYDGSRGVVASGYLGYAPMPAGAEVSPQ
ncbi:hypothetical protein UC34_13665 [Pandoraea vervacti]|uniref:AMP-dependent synthetase/ligase domain-containing protein n=1 Tax=Pandoraea vervacti TaxID=656178 RepID=A0ABN4U7C2_9BURK|nr:AMP-binding protein [Pandoraea vervacti]APD11294.1 hypothetical protein UC34_13665 [Pandoraea vervacti]